jgi:transketolase C-terminal domain/subunit
LLLLQVPVGDYEVELGKAKVARAGSHVTLIGWGNQVNVLAKVSTWCPLCATSAAAVAAAVPSPRAWAR